MYMLKRTLTVLVGLCMIFSISMARDDIMKSPDLEITQSKIIYSDEERIIGMMKVKNNTDIYFPDIYYSIGAITYELADEEENIYESYTIGRQEPVKFSIGANEEVDVYFSYDLPEYLPGDVEELAVTFSTRTMQLSKGDDSIKLDEAIRIEEEGFLLPGLENDVWKINKETVRADTGPNVTTSTKPVAQISLKSTFSTAITVTPKITIYKRLDSYADEPVLSKSGDKISFKANEEKVVEVEVPVISTSDSYFVKIEFCNEKGETVSHEHYFRYVVEGVNGKILTGYITDNEEGLKLNVFATGPADANNKLTDATFSCRIENANDATVLYEESFVANLGKIPGRKIISLERYSSPVNIILKLEKQGTVYDEFSFTVNLNNLESDLEFSDVEDEKVKEAVGILNAIGMISGYPDGTFRPNNSITRAEFTVIATRLAGLELKQGQPSAFPDVPSSHWAKDFINLAQANGCISGYSDGTFKPDKNVTIAESITILVNVLGYRDRAVGSKLSWPLNYLGVAGELGINSDVQYNFNSENASRGKVAVMTLNSFLHKLSKGGN